MNSDSVDQNEEENKAADDPGIASVYEFLTYSISLPERAVRSSSAMIGGALRESTELLVPQAFRSSRSYSTFVTQMLDFMAEDIGGVPSKKSADGNAQDARVEGYVARKAVGNFVELAGMATIHLSPLTILAIVSDLAYGSKEYLVELSDELKKEGVIANDSTIDSAASLLAAVSEASGTTAKAFDTPPLSVDGLKETIANTTQALSGIDPTSLIPQSEIHRMWTSMKETAEQQNVSIFDISSAMTLFTIGKIGSIGTGSLASVRVAGNMFDRHIIDHYRSGISDIQNKGIYGSLAESSKPYMNAVWANFSSEKSTITQDLISGKLVGKIWTGFQGWMGADQSSSSADNS